MINCLGIYKFWRFFEGHGREKLGIWNDIEKKVIYQKDV